MNTHSQRSSSIEKQACGGLLQNLHYSSDMPMCEHFSNLCEHCAMKLFCYTESKKKHRIYSYT